MKDKQKENPHSPDTSKLKAVVIDERTTIFISLEADAQEAKEHYLSKIREKEKRFK